MLEDICPNSSATHRSIFLPHFEHTVKNRNQELLSCNLEWVFEETPTRLAIDRLAKNAVNIFHCLRQHIVTFYLGNGQNRRHPINLKKSPPKHAKARICLKIITIFRTLEPFSSNVWNRQVWHEMKRDERT